jgi:hypothetical protein
MIVAGSLNISLFSFFLSDLNINPYQERVRKALSWAATIGLIILWAFPVAFVGLITNITALCESVSWMRWICNLPVPVNVSLR